MTSRIEAQALKLGYGSKVVTACIDLVLDKPEIISIIGPNGSGKSTLLKALSRLLPPLSGGVLLNGRDIHRLPSREVARSMSILPQSVQSPGDMTVYDLVAYGRMPYKSLLARLDEEDQACIQDAIAAAGLRAMLYRRLDTLSGGEKQRAWLAMALAQQPRLLLLDEPTTYLDIHHQLEFMKLMGRLHRDRELTVVMVLHDLNHAARFSQRLIAVKDGSIFADGPVREVFTSETLRALYKVENTVLDVEYGGAFHPVCLPHDSCPATEG